jgi:hypothetical protein
MGRRDLTDKDKWLVLVDMVTHYRGLLIAGKFLTNTKNISFSRRTLPNEWVSKGVSYSRILSDKKINVKRIEWKNRSPVRKPCTYIWNVTGQQRALAWWFMTFQIHTWFNG